LKVFEQKNALRRLCPELRGERVEVFGVARQGSQRKNKLVTKNGHWPETDRLMLDPQWGEASPKGLFKIRVYTEKERCGRKAGNKKERVRPKKTKVKIEQRTKDINLPGEGSELGGFPVGRGVLQERSQLRKTSSDKKGQPLKNGNGNQDGWDVPIGKGRKSLSAKSQAQKKKKKFEG